MTDPEDWAVDANEALEITLLGPSGTRLRTFHPTFTYPIFGDAETIYGYKGLSLDLSFAAWDFRAYLKVRWDEKIDNSLETEAESVEETLLNYLPKEELFRDENDFQLYLANPSFTMPGLQIDSYTIGTKNYMVCKSSLQDPEAVKLVDRLQLLVLLYIEGGSYVDLGDDRWQIYVLYEKDANEDIPTIVGFATAYPYHFHQKESPTGSDDSFFDTIFCSSPAPVPTYCRLRISQFVILPPFQRSGHGGKLYDMILKNARQDPKVQEISVEDPSEVFEDLRDRRDLSFLEGNSIFKNINAPVSRRWVEETRKQFKMPPRQFRRVLEMSLLRDINPHEDSKEYQNWRLQVKQRLYAHNMDKLAQLAKAERLDKLQETFKVVEDDYLRLLGLSKNGYDRVDLEGEEEDDDFDDDVDDRPMKRVRMA